MQKNHWIKRLILAFLIVGLPWGVLFSLFMGTWFSIHYCKAHLTLDCLTYHLIHYLQKTYWHYLKSAAYFGFLLWAILELQNTFLLTKTTEKLLAETKATDLTLDTMTGSLF